MEEFRQHINVEFINAEPSRIHDICYINNFDATLEFIEKNKDKYEILWTASTDRRIYDEMTAQDVEGWDSLAQMELVITAEKEFHIKFTTKEISELKNVGEFIDMIEKNMIKR